MSQLLGLLQKGFMKLTKGRQLVVVKQEEMVVTESELMTLVESVVVKRSQKLKEKLIESYQCGLEDGLKRGKERAIVLPNIIREENKHLVDVVGLIAKELLEQGDSESCEWLLKKIHQCRSL
ncbi:hypothetical protein [Turicibacter sanguinis]|uniref:hypothetical protein n=1 Tax=Turicibacter sanguinis TaxID=154288 RepID=UPI0018AA1875|nr:hypothetical protein [Turicibacter sanguinis]